MQEVPIGYQTAFEILLTEIEIADQHGLYLGSDKGTWSEYFHGIFQNFRMSSETRSISAHATNFTADILGIAVAEGGDVSFLHFVKVILTTLKLNPSDLSVEGGTNPILKSSRSFEKAMNVRVNVPLSSSYFETY
jgi:hypothetical protein